MSVAEHCDQEPQTGGTEQGQVAMTQIDRARAFLSRFHHLTSLPNGDFDAITPQDLQPIFVVFQTRKNIT